MRFGSGTQTAERKKAATVSGPTADCRMSRNEGDKMRPSRVAIVVLALVAFGCSGKKPEVRTPPPSSQTMMLSTTSFDGMSFARNPFDDDTYVPPILATSLEEVRSTHTKEMAEFQEKVRNANAEGGYVAGTAFKTATFAATYVQISLAYGKRGFLRHSLRILSSEAKLKDGIRLGMKMADLLEKVWKEYPGTAHKVLPGRYYMSAEEDVWLYFDTNGEVLDALQVVVGD